MHHAFHARSLGIGIRSGKVLPALHEADGRVGVNCKEGSLAMNRSRVAVLVLALAVSTAVGMAQSQRPMPLGPGDPFPALEVYDAIGKPFNTKSLTGQYTVLVNGCLT